MSRRARRAAGLLALALGAALPGCATNPATGEATFTGGQSIEEEAATGRKLHPSVLAENGGRYGSDELQRYVADIGQRLARVTERRGIAYTFTVLDSEDANAMAMPGGYIYVSRGLMALAGDEAELAAVLAHELGHINALHHARGHGRTVLAQIGLLAAGVLANLAVPGAASGIMRLGGAGAAGILSSYTREDELEADDLGMRYLARAGYDPEAMPRLFTKLRAEERLRAEIEGVPPDSVDRTGYLATHPATVERISRATARAREVSVERPITAREAYYARIDGMVFGEDPAAGAVRGRTYLDTTRRLTFTVPEGFRLKISPGAVSALGPHRAMIVFQAKERRGEGSPRSYLRRVWVRGAVLHRVEEIEINGMPAATGTTRIDTDRGWVDVRPVAVFAAPDRVLRLLFLTPVSRTRGLERELRRTTYSLRRMTAREAAAVKPRRLRIVRAGAGDTAETLARRMAVPSHAREWLAALNGLGPDEPVRPGVRVKIVAE